MEIRQKEAAQYQGPVHADASCCRRGPRRVWARYINRYVDIYRYSRKLVHSMDFYGQVHAGSDHLWHDREARSSSMIKLIALLTLEWCNDSERSRTRVRSFIRCVLCSTNISPPRLGDTFVNFSVSNHVCQVCQRMPKYAFSIDNLYRKYITRGMFASWQAYLFRKILFFTFFDTSVLASPDLSGQLLS